MHRRETQQGNRRYVELADGIARILAFEPAQWIRFTSDNVAPNTPGAPFGAAIDLSGNNRSVSQGNAAQQPIFANPGADGDGVNDVLGSAGGAFLNGIPSCSLFIVADLTGQALSLSNQMYGVDANNFHFDFGGAGGAPRMSVQLNTAAFFLPEGPTGLSGATGRHVFDCRLTDGSCRVWDNGAPGTEVATAWGAGVIAVPAAPFVCAGRSDGFRPFPGVIQDTIVFTTALSVANQASVRALLAQLEGVTL